MFAYVILIIVGVILAIGVIFWLVGERGRLLRPSTWKMMRAAGLRRIFNLSGLHGYVYGRWVRQYINLLLNVIYPRLGPRSRKWLADRYHAKILTHEQAKNILTLRKEIPLQDLEQIIPYPTARDLVLKGPPDVAVLQCACRQARDHPCEPIQVCMLIGQPFVDFTLEHHPRTSRRLTQAEALELLQAEHERGHVHSAWFKDACLGRFYAICNCCKCCCGGIEVMVKYGVPQAVSSGYVAQVDASLCTACTACEDACPFRAIHVNDVSVVDWDRCMGCGVCVGRCANDAIALTRDERKGIPLDVRLLTEN